jgi:hypothetical protein
VRRTLTTLLAVAMLWATLVVPADAAQGNPVEVITSGYTSDPALVNDPSLVFKALDRGAAPATLGATTSATEPLHTLSAQQVQQQALNSKNYEVTPLDRYASGAPSAASPPYDYTNFAECKTHQKQSGSTTGWVKNHFAYCHRDLAWARAKKCAKLGCVNIGDVQIVVTLIGYGKMGGFPSNKNERYMEFGMSLDQVKATGAWTASGATWSISMQCKGSPSPSSCLPGSFNGGKKSIADWSKDRSTKFQLVSPAKAASKANGAQIAFGFTQTTSQFAAPGAKIDPVKAIGDRSTVRFDSVWYNPYYRQGSVFTQLIPFIAFSTATESGYQEASQHILMAFTKAGTVPPYPDKPLYLPGGNYKNPFQLPTDTSKPLHRLYWGLSTKNNGRYNSNNYYAAKACDQWFSGWRKKKSPSGESYQCDEYPFRSTYEGAARFKTDGKKYENLFSAMPILSDENTKAGNMIGVWYSYDRILDDDFFFIRLQN